MEWKLVDVTQETYHKFLNYFTLHYSVKKDDGTTKPYEYYMASRHSLEELRAKTKEYSKPDAVLIVSFRRNPDGTVSYLLERQFRPCFGTRLLSFPAGLCDPDDKDIETTARRELREETGYEAKSVELLVPPASTSAGMSDEANAIVLVEIAPKNDGTEKEEFEDLQARWASTEEVKQMLADPNLHFAGFARICLLYCLERFGK